MRAYTGRFDYLCAPHISVHTRGGRAVPERGHLRLPQPQLRESQTGVRVAKETQILATDAVQAVRSWIKWYENVSLISNCIHSNGDLTAQQQQHQQQQLRANDPFWGPCGPRDSDADISTLLDGSNAGAGAADADCNGSGAGSRASNESTLEVPAKDSIAEPLYALMGEIFDMGGVFKWLRRSIISFVQITYGRTINRQIRDTVHAAFDEPQLHAYVSAALQSFWPGGELAAAAPTRSEDMQQMTATAAQSLLLDNMPEWICNLVGAQTARHGALKVWRAVQNAAWNKQLFYVSEDVAIFV